jgi:HEAT repeat protein
VRQAAAKVLGRLDASGVTEALVTGATDPDSRVRAAVMVALGGKKRSLAAPTVIRAVAGDTHPSVRADAARAMGRLKIPSALEQLTALLKVDSDQDVVRTGAVDGLKRLGDARAVEAVLPFLAYRWGKGANHVLRQAALNCVTALAPDEKAVHGAIVPLVRDPYHRMRSWAAQAAGKFGVRQAIPDLVKVSKADTHGGVKNAAKKALKRLGWKAPEKKKDKSGKKAKAAK